MQKQNHWEVEVRGEGWDVEAKSKVKECSCCCFWTNSTPSLLPSPISDFTMKTGKTKTPMTNSPCCCHTSGPWDISFQNDFCVFWYKAHMQFVQHFFPSFLPWMQIWCLELQQLSCDHKGENKRVIKMLTQTLTLLNKQLNQSLLLGFLLSKENEHLFI
jgi:hypothetical protein